MIHATRGLTRAYSSYTTDRLIGGTAICGAELEWKADMNPTPSRAFAWVCTNAIKAENWDDWDGDLENELGQKCRPCDSILTLEVLKSD